VGRLIIDRTQADLLQVIGAPNPPRRLTGRLHRGQQEGDEHADDRDHDQHLDHGKSPAGTGLSRDVH
jgi:hypothetical protein